MSFVFFPSAVPLDKWECSKSQKSTSPRATKRGGQLLESTKQAVYLVWPPFFCTCELLKWAMRCKLNQRTERQKCDMFWIFGYKIDPIHKTGSPYLVDFCDIYSHLANICTSFSTAVFLPMNECIFRHSHPSNNSVFITFCFSLALGLLFRRIMADLAIWPQIPNKSGYTKTLYTFFFKNVCLQMRMLNVQAGQPSYRNISCSTTKPKTAHLSNNRHCLCLGKIIHNPHT